VVVDHKKKALERKPQSSGQRDQLASRHRFVPQLHDVRSAPRRGGRDLEDSLRRRLRRDDVEPRRG
jgi:hypothetical protein